MELAGLGRLCCRCWRIVLLWVLCAVSGDTRFSMGKSVALRNRRRVVDRRLVPSVWPAATLSRQVFGSIFSAIALLFLAFFCYEIFYMLRQVPASSGAPRVGQKAPDFILLDQNGNPVGLGDLLRGPSGPKAVALIFYRGFW